MSLLKTIKNILAGMSTLTILPPELPTRDYLKFLKRTDSEALADDWKKVGQDFQQALYKFEQNNNRNY